MRTGNRAMQPRSWQGQGDAQLTPTSHLLSSQGALCRRCQHCVERKNPSLDTSTPGLCPPFSHAGFVMSSKSSPL